MLTLPDNGIGISTADCEVKECMCWQGGARRMLKQLKGKSSDETLDDIDADDEFSDLGVLDDSNSMYMVGNVSLQVIAASSSLQRGLLPSTCENTKSAQFFIAAGACSATACDWHKL
jgi:hypothetical protein